MTDQNKKILDDYIEKIESTLSNFTSDKDCIQSQILEAMEYSLMAGGKRLRPVLMLEFYKMCGGENADSLVDVACSIEMIHTFSLIHDDLPCMDNDDFRRGKPSCHKAFPENIALLAGDALNTLAFETITNAVIDGRINAQTGIMLISVLSKAVGTNGMIGGQVIDLECENKQTDKQTLDILQSLKTGALIEAACVMGVIMAGKPEMIKYAADYAQSMGRAFQIVDDILDVTGTFEELGKPIGSDEEQHKTTYVSLLGIDNAERMARQLTVQSFAYLKNFENNNFISELTEDLLSRKR